ncbi:MAG TPA: dTMP kinase [Candidatus Sulfomarinibacteraceae bacterium]|nr:dTMP kinase [Candidatus Sulfomarinibacteraceae bacterium]
MFITFEGPDGSGKTTQIALLANFLREQGFSVLTTREPGGTAIGDQIRACLHDVRNTGMTAAAEILLYSASRAQLVQETIRPALAEGRIVLCDRYADSTLAYQGHGRGLSLDDLTYITRFATGDLRPDLTFLLDLDAEAGLQRRETGGDEINRMDMQSASFYQRVREGYRKMAADEPERWIVLDADRPVNAIQCDVREAVTERLNLRM